MGRAPCCDKNSVKRGPWAPEEDAKLRDFIERFGVGGSWISLPQKAGLKRCGKSCRLRWLNYLRPNIKHGDFSDEEDRIICSIYAMIGSRWSIMATQLPGRTDNDIKNHWNTKLKKKLLGSTMTMTIPSTATVHGTSPPPLPPFYNDFNASQPHNSLANESSLQSLETLSGSGFHHQIQEGFNELQSYPVFSERSGCSSSEETGVFQGFLNGNSSFLVQDNRLSYNFSFKNDETYAW